MPSTQPSSPQADPTLSSPRSLDAQGVATGLTAAGLPAKTTIVFTESNDPNDLLGRPNGYTSKVGFADNRIKREPGQQKGDVRLGGSVECYPDPDGARRRAEYIVQLSKSVPLAGTEYDYVRGTCLLRVSSRLTPTQARKYEAALQTVVP